MKAATSQSGVLILEVDIVQILIQGKFIGYHPIQIL